MLLASIQNGVPTQTSAPLFDPERLRVYPRIMLAVYIVAGIAVVLTAKAMIDIFGKPLGYDFIVFWSASKLTLAGDAVAAFDMRRIFTAQRLAVPAGDSIYLWHYPPTYQLLIAPLALMPYVLSYFVFVGGTLAAYALTLRKLFDHHFGTDWDRLFILLAFPGVFICVFHGQNSLLSAALFAGAILAMDKRPVVAGICLGLLAYKPQLGLLIPFALLASGQWRVFFSACVTVLGFTALSTLVLGPDLWTAFLKNTPLVRQIMENGFLPWAKMPSAFIFFRMLHFPEWFAYGTQIVTALGAAAAVTYVWYVKGPTRLAFAVLVSATLLVPPYTFDYEFAIMAVPLVLLANDMAMRGATRREKIALLFLYAVPIFVAPLAEHIPLQLGYPALLLALYLCVTRALAEPRNPVLAPA